jgi:hypothetical protein
MNKTWHKGKLGRNGIEGARCQKDCRLLILRAMRDLTIIRGFIKENITIGFPILKDHFICKVRGHRLIEGLL